MATNEPKAVMNFRIAVRVKRLVESFAHQRGISMAAATAHLLVAGLKAEGVETCSLADEPEPAAV